MRPSQKRRTEPVEFDDEFAIDTLSPPKRTRSGTSKLTQDLN